MLDLLPQAADKHQYLRVYVGHLPAPDLREQVVVDQHSARIGGEEDLQAVFDLREVQWFAGAETLTALHPHHPRECNTFPHPYP